MDRKDYYRVLGVREDATPEQIRAAYEERMHKLSSLDYRDDPEYARRKKQDVTMAYRVITGGAAPMNTNQKKLSFEKLKDRMESREGNEIDDDSAMRRREDAGWKGQQYGSSSSAGSAGASRRRGKSPAKIIIAVVLIAILIGGISSCVGAVADFVSGAIDDMELAWDFSSSDEISQEKMDLIDEAQDFANGLNYYEMLDMTTMATYESAVDLGLGTEKYGGSDVYGATFDVIWELDITGMDEFYTYITGIEDYYFDYDDTDCAEMLTGWMGAPAFYEVAGATNMYTGQVILNHADYLEYLERLINENR